MLRDYVVFNETGEAVRCSDDFFSLILHLRATERVLRRQQYEQYAMERRGQNA